MQFILSCFVILFVNFPAKKKRPKPTPNCNASSEKRHPSCVRRCRTTSELPKRGWQGTSGFYRPKIGDPSPSVRNNTVHPAKGPTSCRKGLQAYTHIEKYAFTTYLDSVDVDVTFKTVTAEVKAVESSSDYDA